MATGFAHEQGYLRFRCVAALAVLCCSVLLSIAQQPPDTSKTDVSKKKVPLAAMTVAFVDVPDVRGQRLDDAQTSLQRAGLHAGNISNASAPGVVGTVWQQNPEANTPVARGSAVDLVMTAPQKPKSPGGGGDPELSRQVPDLSGLTSTQASDRLANTRLFLGSVSTGKGGGTAGAIYAQKPPPGTWARIGTKIDVEIAPQQKKPDVVWVYVPNLVGQEEKNAEAMLPKFGLTLGNVSRGSASAPVGTVFGQYPLPKSRVIQGTQISLQIAQAPQQNPIVQVPSVISQNVNEAESVLLQAGLKLGEVRTEETSDANPNAVTGQSPEAGTRVERGTQVSVVIAQPIPMVEVPDLVNHPQTNASGILDAVDLQLGTVSEQESEKESGTVLSQTPPAHETVRAGSAVNVVVSHYVIRGLTVLLANPNPKRGDPVRLQADLEPPGAGAEYRFDFGDGTQSDWLNSSGTTHTYKAGDFHIKAYARIGNTTTISDPVSINVPGWPWAVIFGVIGGIAVLGGGGFVYHGWKMFQASVRVVPHSVVGTQEVYVASGSTRSEQVTLRVMEGKAVTTVRADKEK